MTVGELIIGLGLDVDEKKWSAGDAAIKQMANELKRLAVSAMLATTDVKKAAQVIGLPAAKAGNELEKLAKTGDNVTGRFRSMLVAAAAFFGAAKIGGLVQDTIDLGGKLNDTAQKTGLSAERLQELGYAAKLNSSSMEEIADATEKFSHKLDDVKKGQGPVADSFRKLGISLNDPAVKSKDLDALLNLVANRFSAMPDGVEKTAIAMDLFGRSGANLIPTFNTGIRGLAGYADEARRVGYVLSNETVTKLDDLGDNVDRAKMAFAGLKNQAIAALLPTLNEMVTSLTEWIAANKELIASTIVTVVQTLASVVTTLGHAVAFAVEHWQALAAILGAGAIVSGLMSIIKMIALFQSAQTAAAAKAVVAWAAILGPILLIAAAILGLGYLIYRFRDKIRAAFGAAWSWLKRQFWDFVDSVKQGAQTVYDTAASIAEKIREFFGSIADAVREAWTKAVAFVVAKAEALLDNKAVQAVLSAGGFAGVKNAVDVSRARGNPAVAAEQLAQQTGATSAIAGLSGLVGGPSRDVATFPTAVAPATVNVQSTYAPSITTTADPAKVKEVVDRSLQEHDERVRRQTAAGLGIVP